MENGINKPLDSSVVQICTDKGDDKGLGFLVSEKHVLTCAHVVAKALGLPDNTSEKPNGEVYLNFPFLKSNDLLTARISEWHPICPDEGGDVAELELESTPPGARAMPLLKTDNLWGHEIRAYGFPKKKHGGIYASSILRDVQATGWLQMDIGPLSTYPVQPGFSGTPVWDMKLKGIVGMVAVVDTIESIDDAGEKKIEIKAAFCIPSKTLQTYSSHSKITDPPALIKYRDSILTETRWVNLKGIPFPQAIEPKVPLNKVYIHIQAIEYGAPEEVEINPLIKRIKEQMRLNSRRPPLQNALTTMGEYFYHRGEVYKTAERPSPVDPQKALRNHDRMVILGAPGAGKSTMLRYIAHCAADDDNGPVPILITLRDYATELSQDSTLSLREFALKKVTDRDEVLLRELLADAIEKKRVLWLLDALDEVRELPKKGLVVQVADEACRLPGQLILTSRPTDYVGTGQIGTLHHFEVLPLETTNVDQFLYDWFNIIAENYKKKPDWVEQRVAQLQEQLHERPRLQQLLRNPLMLTFIAILAEEENLPDQRAELYQRYVEKLFDSWERERQTPGSANRPKDSKLGKLLEGSTARDAAIRGLYYIGWYLHLTYYGQRKQMPDREAVLSELEKHYKAEATVC
jgi:energy-coupling factor transporter ATP-binding protein EcfA2